MRASIDVGTNTTLLLVAEEVNGRLVVLHEEQRMTRLGQNVDQAKKLHSDAMHRVVEAIKEYQDILSTRFNLSTAIVTGTSAVRDASNRQEFLELIKTKTGLTVQILSGKEEADYTYNGALSVLEGAEREGKFDTLVLDIGGGSTEIILARKGKIKDAFSFDIGCVRFTERYLKNNPPFSEEIAQCEEEIMFQFSKKKFKTKNIIQAIGVAGTITSLAAIDLQVEQFDKDKIDNHSISLEKLSKGIEIFSLHTYDQLIELHPEILKGREDVFLAGLLILKTFLKLYGIDEITASTGGVRHGALLKKIGD